MPIFRRETPDPLDVKLENRSSDDSLILEETSTNELWAERESEPATFHVNSSSHAERFAPGRRSSSLDFRNEWRDSKESVDRSDVFNATLQTRLSLSGEESEVPLLSSENWMPGGFLGAASHCHPQISTPTNNSAWRRLMSASLLCLFFMIAEIIGGYYAGSVAVMTDAAHLLSDLVGLLVSLSAVWLGQRPPTKTLSFGFHRAEVLGALFSIFVIWIMTGIFVYIAAERLASGAIDIKADTMMAVAAGGIVINIIMGLVLHGGCNQLNAKHHGFGNHGHSHDNLFSDDNCERHLHQSPSCMIHDVNQARRRSENPTSTQTTNFHTSKRTNINVRAASIHVLGDLIQSIGVFVAAVVIKFRPEAKIADPICTFLFAIVVLGTTIPILRDTGLILLEGCPQSISYNQVFAILNNIAGVKHVHSLHVWSLTAGKHALSVHLALDTAVDRDTVTSAAQQIMQTKFGVQFCTIQTENFDHLMINSCFLCKSPSS